MFRLDELMKFKQEHPIIEEAHENILKPEDAEWGWNESHTLHKSLDNFVIFKISSWSRLNITLFKYINIS